MTKFLTILNKILPQLLPLFFILIIIFAICIFYMFDKLCYKLYTKKLEYSNKNKIFHYVKNEKVHYVPMKNFDDFDCTVAIAYAV